MRNTGIWCNTTLQGVLTFRTYHSHNLQGGCEECTSSGTMHNSCSDSYVITVEQRSYPMGI